MKLSMKGRRAFTLMEMLVVFVILGIVSLIGVYGYQAALRKGESDAFISRLQTELTPLVYGQGTVLSKTYGTFSAFAADSVTPGQFTASVNENAGPARGIYVRVGSDNKLETIATYVKKDFYNPNQINELYYNATGNTNTDDVTLKSINIPSSVFFDSACLVDDSHDNCDGSVGTITKLQGEISVAYHGSRSQPYVVVKNGTTNYYAGKGVRLNFKSPLNSLWYTITFSPYGGMTVGRGCRTDVCL